MNVYGSIRRLVSAVFRKDSNDVSLRPSQAVTYTGAVNVDFPPSTASQILVGDTATQILTNKTLGSTNTLTGATAATFTNTGVVTLFTATDTVVGKATTDVLTNKTMGATNTLTGATASSFTNTGTVTLFTASDTVVGKATTDILTNKSISGSTNTITNVSLTTGVTGTLPLANGGTNAVTANAAFNNLAPSQTANSGKYLTTNGTDTSWATVATVTSSNTNWITSDGVTKTITHSFGSLDVIVQIYDKADGATITIDNVVRTDTNTVTLTSSEAPNASGWRVMILKNS